MMAISHQKMRVSFLVSRRCSCSKTLISPCILTLPDLIVLSHFRSAFRSSATIAAQAMAHSNGP